MTSVTVGRSSFTYIIIDYILFTPYMEQGPMTEYRDTHKKWFINQLIERRMTFESASEYWEIPIHALREWALNVHHGYLNNVKPEYPMDKFVGSKAKQPKLTIEISNLSELNDLVLRLSA